MEIAGKMPTPLCILLIEDNPGDVRLTQLALRDCDYPISMHVALDGREGLDFLKREGSHALAPRPDVILLDLNLPKMDGREVLTRLKEDDDLKAIPIIILTSSDAEADIVRSYQLQANCYLSKPVQFEAFENVLKAISSFWFTKVRLPHPLVVLTGSDSQSLATQALQNGAQDYLVKGQIEPRGLQRALLLAAEREVHQRELERSNVDLERFAYIASHDLKAPLRAIGHLVQWIDEDIGATASPTTIENLDLLKGRVARLHKLLDGLLAYARVGRETAMIENVDIAEEVQAVIDMLELPPGFTVVCNGEMPVIPTYRVPIHMILKNLITNALQHHDRSEGRITVTMQLSDGIAEVSSTKAAWAVRLTRQPTMRRA